MKILIPLILLLFTAPAFAGTAVVGSIWKQEDQTALPADDIVAISFTGISTIGLVLGEANLVRVVNVQTGAVATGTTTIPLDDSIPENDEGDEYMTLAIEPMDASNILRINIVIHLEHSSANLMKIAALFQDSIVEALANSASTEASATTFSFMNFTHYMVAGTTSPITFKVRAGGHSAGTTTFNGSGGSRLFGGALASSITITEFKP